MGQSVQKMDQASSSTRRPLFLNCLAQFRYLFEHGTLVSVVRKNNNY